MQCSGGLRFAYRNYAFPICDGPRLSEVPGFNRLRDVVLPRIAIWVTSGRVFTFYPVLFQQKRS